MRDVHYSMTVTLAYPEQQKTICYFCRSFGFTGFAVSFYAASLGLLGLSCARSLFLSLSVVVLSSLWSYYPLCGRTKLCRTILSVVVLSSPLCGCTILSVVVLNSVVLSSLWSYYPLCGRTILSVVVLSSLWSY